MELPQYTMYLSLRRILLPRAVILIFLGGLLYFGVWLNLMILNIEIPTEWNIYIILGIAVLVAIQGILNYLKFSSYRYIFYRDRIIFQGKKETVILYSEIQSLEFSKDFLDSFFNTGKINLAPIHRIEHIENINQIYFYIQKLVEYSRQYSMYNYKSQNLSQNPYYTPSL